MNELKFDIQPLAAPNICGAELRATWAQFKILVGDKCISRVVDRRMRGERDSLFISLYPIAEWLTFHWWHLLYEVENPDRESFALYIRRHSPWFGREGYSFPKVALVPTGEKIRIQWTPWLDVSGRLEFIEPAGSAVLDPNQVKEALFDLISAVVDRLASEGLTQTPLQTEWDSLKSTQPEEKQFCIFASMLGLDPYELEDYEQQKILKAIETLPINISAEFSTSAKLNYLIEAVEEVLNDIDLARQQDEDLDVLKAVRNSLVKPTTTLSAWSAGYEAARNVRAFLNLDGQILNSDASFRTALGVTESAVKSQPSQHSLFEGVVAANSRESPGFVLHSQDSESARFTLCRAIHEYLFGAVDSGAVARTYTDRQKRNRAFAAEMLAPAEAIRQRLEGRSPDIERVGVLAREFGVSPILVQNQIHNQIPELSHLLPHPIHPLQADFVIPETF